MSAGSFTIIVLLLPVRTLVIIGSWHYKKKWWDRCF